MRPETDLRTYRVYSTLNPTLTGYIVLCREECLTRPWSQEFIYQGSYISCNRLCDMLNSMVLTSRNNLVQKLRRRIEVFREGKLKLDSKVISDIRKFLKRSKMPQSRLGRLALNDSRAIQDVLRGDRELRPKTETRLREFMLGWKGIYQREYRSKL